ncbi:succinylglutamate desuccinylase [Halomonas sp. Choline-3u-9]|nr:succinylglutamate desuccinylase [Halomonas sp. Choline-3u-9]QGQ71287.1 succinylglutamate desuccinylase [Halomonas sp. PA16-9]
MSCSASRLTPHASRLTPHASRLTPHASRLTFIHPFDAGTARLPRFHK